jgi:hypothetical protein
MSQECCKSDTADSPISILSLEVKKIFDPVVNHIIDLVKEQVVRVQEKGEAVAVSRPTPTGLPDDESTSHSSIPQLIRLLRQFFWWGDLVHRNIFCND